MDIVNKRVYNGAIVVNAIIQLYNYLNPLIYIERNHYIYITILYKMNGNITTISFKQLTLKDW